MISLLCVYWMVIEMETEMDKKIEALKNAYASKDSAKLVKAAQSLLAYDRKHPMASVINPEATAIVNLARKIVAVA